MTRMTSIPTFAAALALTVQLGCSHESKAEATAEPGSAHAVAKSDGRTVAPEDAYQADKVSRTGVVIDRDLAKSCDLQDPETFFAFDSAALSPRTEQLLGKLADCVSKGKLAGRELELVGHADPQGSDAYNKELGMSRAESVAGFLREHGVDAAKIEVNSVGESGASEEIADWPLDRRVDIAAKPERSASL